jgi:hypothetical protein
MLGHRGSSRRAASSQRSFISRWHWPSAQTVGSHPVPFHFRRAVCCSMRSIFWLGWAWAPLARCPPGLHRRPALFVGCLGRDGDGVRSFRATRKAQGIEAGQEAGADDERQNRSPSPRAERLIAGALRNSLARRPLIVNNRASSCEADFEWNVRRISEQTRPGGGRLPFGQPRFGGALEEDGAAFAAN